MRVWVILISLLLPLATFAFDDIPKTGELADLYKKAKSGDPEAQYTLAEAYKNGDGVQQDINEALKWYHRAATQGYVEGQIALGFIYRGGNGRNGPYMDKVLSYMWFDIAARNGDERAFNLRNDIAWSMTQSEIDEARAKSKAWRPGQYDGFDDDDD